GPIMEVAEFEWQQFDSARYRTERFGVPGKQNMAAWKRMWNHGSIGFPYDKLPLLVKAKDQRPWWRLPPPNNDRVPAVPNVAHHVHCLDMLW
ncbi:hypothetical protein EJ03DRAFT_244864, partial [Teratosphaeria nubilosa]